MHIPASFPSLKGRFPRSSCHRPHLVLFVVLAQAWGCQAKTWHTKGQLHVSFFPSTVMLASVPYQIAW